MAKKQTPQLALPVDFGNVSLGDGVASVRVQIDREQLQLSEADEQICGRRLTGEIAEGDYNPSQRLMFKNMNYKVSGAFDVKSILVKRKSIAFGLSFSIEDINVEELSHFAKKKGALVVYESESLNGDGSEDESEEQEEA